MYFTMKPLSLETVLILKTALLKICFPWKLIVYKRFSFENSFIENALRRNSWDKFFLCKHLYIMYFSNFLRNWFLWKILFWENFPGKLFKIRIQNSIETQNFRDVYFVSILCLERIKVSACLPETALEFIISKRIHQIFSRFLNPA